MQIVDNSDFIFLIQVWLIFNVSLYSKKILCGYSTEWYMNDWKMFCLFLRIHSPDSEWGQCITMFTILSVKTKREFEKKTRPSSSGPPMLKHCCNLVTSDLVISHISLYPWISLVDDHLSAFLIGYDCRLDYP